MSLLDIRFSGQEFITILYFTVLFTFIVGYFIQKYYYREEGE